MCCGISRPVPASWKNPDNRQQTPPCVAGIPFRPICSRAKRPALHSRPLSSLTTAVFPQLWSSRARQVRRLCCPYSLSVRTSCVPDAYFLFIRCALWLRIKCAPAVLLWTDCGLYGEPMQGRAHLSENEAIHTMLICQFAVMKHRYYPTMRFRRETKFSEEWTASTGAGGRH
jgi:hypothetical protein